MKKINYGSDWVKKAYETTDAEYFKKHLLNGNWDIDDGMATRQRTEITRKTDDISEGEFYVIPSNIPNRASRGVIKSFFSGRIAGEVTIVDTENNGMLLLFSDNEDAAQYKMSGWEDDILEFLKY